MHAQPPSRSQFQLSYNPLTKVILSCLLAGPRRSRVTVDDHRLVVTMGAGGWLFHTTVPRSYITAAEPVRGPAWGWGAHGWRGRWLINGSSSGLVRLTINPDARGRCIGVPTRVRALTISLERPDEFVSAVNAAR